MNRWALTCLVLLLFAVVLPIPSILAAEKTKEDAAKDTNQVGDGKYRCNYCCGGWYYGSCRKWCCSPNEAKIVNTEAEPEKSEAADQKSNQVDDAKSRCNYCCGGWYYGKCRKWCCSPNEANLEDTEAMPEKSVEASDQQSNPQVGGEKNHWGGGHGGGGHWGGHGGGHGGGGRGGGHGGGGGKGGGHGGGGGKGGGHGGGGGKGGGHGGGGGRGGGGGK